ILTVTAAVLLLLIHSIAAVEGGRVVRATFRGEYDSFNESYYGIFRVESPATISNGALQVTPDSASAIFSMYNNSGRVLIDRPFRLWDSAAGAAASFNTSFLVNIYRPNGDPPGEGLTFVIAPDLELPANSYGEYLGLTNASTDGAAANRLIAVELDTFKEDFDPDDNHVGIDVNGVRSIRTASLTPYNITLAPTGAIFHNVWVDYDGISLHVYIAELANETGPTPAKPSSPILTADLNLTQIVNQASYFGFSASTGNTSQLNCIRRWNITINYFHEVNDDEQMLKLTLGIGLPVLALIGAAAAGIFLRRKWRERESKRKLTGTLKALPGAPREFDFRELNKATKNFDEKNKLGQGGYGVVYRGLLEKENAEIAVKRFSRESIKGQDDFLSELTIINRLRHKHLVKLLGWCHKNRKLLLVYECMPNGSLDKHLFSGASDGTLLGWDLRYRIISGVAAALLYLHEEYDQRVLHRDLKPSNIMLDSDFNARLGDFGLARALENGKTSYAEAAGAGILGTMGYIAPECFHTAKASQQSDVYAFGVVVLEVVCGQRPGTKIGGFQTLLDWVWFMHRDGKLLEAVDKRLGNSYVPEEANRLLLLGLACCRPTATERPKTVTIPQIISGTAAAPYVPPFKPPFVWPS
ncbi:hypothetical protein M569_03718, partial [Genlisea aurea]